MDALIAAESLLEVSSKLMEVSLLCSHTGTSQSQDVLELLLRFVRDEHLGFIYPSGLRAPMFTVHVLTKCTTTLYLRTVSHNSCYHRIADMLSPHNRDLHAVLRTHFLDK